ncbi:MAG TPA: hypothetical protein VMB03_30260 [Bryobacteraceae bacterium]|nr:hypothetical protein [Bryobacteraceae bacterium]
MLEVLVSFGVLNAQPPSYTAADIVNASDYSAGPFAPNSVLSIFGSNLSWDTATYTLQAGQAALPTELASVQVGVDEWQAPLLYVSPSQINFLVPSTETSGSAVVRVVREGVAGPPVTVTLVAGAPALFSTTAGFAIATHLDGSPLTDASPGQAGEFVVVYATGLGVTSPNPAPGEIPTEAAEIQLFGSLNVSLNGAALPALLVSYAGVTPGYAGLYQLNIRLPQGVPADPVIQVSVGTQSSGSLKLAAQ